MTTSHMTYDTLSPSERARRAEVRAEDAAHDQREGQRQPSTPVPNGSAESLVDSWAKAYAKARGDVPDRAA